jgi:transcriptional regulator with XRE-family HTH domain
MQKGVVVEDFIAACERLRALMGLSMQDFGDRLGVGRTTYNYYTRGGTFPVSFVQAMVRTFPEMRPYAEALLFGDRANISSGGQPIGIRRPGRPRAAAR